MRRLHNTRGAALMVAIATALIGATMSYTLMAMALNQAHHAKFYRERTDARYVAEAALVLAQEKLREANSGGAAYPPTGVMPPRGQDCAVLGTPAWFNEFVDLDGDGVTADGDADGFADAPDGTAEVQITNCGAGRTHTLKVKAVY